MVGKSRLKKAIKKILVATAIITIAYNAVSIPNRPTSYGEYKKQYELVIKNIENKSIPKNELKAVVKELDRIGHDLVNLKIDMDILLDRDSGPTSKLFIERHVFKSG